MVCQVIKIGFLLCLQKENLGTTFCNGIYKFCLEKLCFVVQMRNLDIYLKVKLRAKAHETSSHSERWVGSFLKLFFFGLFPNFHKGQVLSLFSSLRMLLSYCFSCRIAAGTGAVGLCFSTNPGTLGILTTPIVATVYL